MLSGSPPWQWPVWWSNALSLGAEMGDDFRRGLLRAAGVAGGALDLSGQLGPDRQMALRVVVELMAVLTECSLIHNDLDVESANMLAKIGTEKRIMLSGMKCDQTEVDFSHQDLKPADGILIASDLVFMAVLTTLKHLRGGQRFIRCAG